MGNVYINASGAEYYLDPKAEHPFWGDDKTVADITATATVDGTTGTPSVNVTQTGEHGENIDFAFSGLKGEKGDKGDVGPAGPEGPQGPKGDDGTSVIPANTVKNVTMDATPDVTMGTTDYDLAYRTNDDQKHNAQTMHLATKQLVLENALTSAGNSGKDKIGEITLYTIDQTGNTGSQAFGIVAITQTDGSVSLCPAINKDGTWEYGQEFLKIPSIPQNYVKEAYIGNPIIQDDMQYYSLRKIMVRDGVEQAESHENFGTFDPEYMVENVLLDGGWTSPSGKYTTNKATFKTRWNHGGVVTEQTGVFAINAPITDKNYTDVTMTSATTDSGTTYSLKKTDMDGKEADIGTIEIPKAGGGGGSMEKWQYNFLEYTSSLFATVMSDMIIAEFQVPVYKQLYLTYSSGVLFNIYNASGEVIAANVYCSIDTPSYGVVRVAYSGQFTAPVNSIARIIPKSSLLISVSTTQEQADAAYNEFKAAYDAEHTIHDVDVVKKDVVKKEEVG